MTYEAARKVREDKAVELAAAAARILDNGDLDADREALANALLDWQAASRLCLHALEGDAPPAHGCSFCPPDGSRCAMDAAAGAGVGR